LVLFDVADPFFDGILQKDVSAPVLPVGAYATTVRRKLIEIAGKIVKHGKTVIFKVSRI